MERSPKMQQVISIGMILIFIGFAMVFFGALSSSKEASSNTKVAIGGFIGPLPFGFGNDKTLVWVVTILSAVIFLFWLFFSFRIAKP